MSSFDPGILLTLVLVIGFVLLVRRALRRSPSTGTIARIRGPGAFAVEVVGESFHTAAFHKLIKRMKPDDLSEEWFGDAMLVLEDDNPHDSEAVGVSIDGLKIGHLSREMARDFRRAIKRDKLTQFREFAVGARLYFGGDNERHSVSIDLPQT